MPTDLVCVAFRRGNPDKKSALSKGVPVRFVRACASSSRRSPVKHKNQSSGSAPDMQRYEKKRTRAARDKADEMECCATDLDLLKDEEDPELRDMGQDLAVRLTAFPHASPSSVSTRPTLRPGRLTPVPCRSAGEREPTIVPGQRSRGEPHRAGRT